MLNLAMPSTLKPSKRSLSKASPRAADVPASRRPMAAGPRSGGSGELSATSGAWELGSHGHGSPWVTMGHHASPATTSFLGISCEAALLANSRRGPTASRNLGHAPK